MIFNQLEGINLNWSKISQVKSCSMKSKIQRRKDVGNIHKNINTCSTFMLKNNVRRRIKCILTEIRQVNK